MRTILGSVLLCLVPFCSFGAAPPPNAHSRLDAFLGRFKEESVVRTKTATFMAIDVDRGKRLIKHGCITFVKFSQDTQKKEMTTIVFDEGYLHVHNNKVYIDLKVYRLFSTDGTVIVGVRMQDVTFWFLDE